MALNLTPFLVTGRVLDVDQESKQVALAFSVRKTNSLYSGPCCRVRRQDGLEQDIGFVQTDIDIKTLLSFVGANGQGYVSVWYDQSGQGLHAKQDTWALQPRIVIDGALVTDPDSNQISIQFDGRQYFDTPYEPTESDVKASAIQIVGSSGLTQSSLRQGGSVYEYGRWALNASVLTKYPNTNIPQGYDVTYLESQTIGSNVLVYATASDTYGLLKPSVELNTEKGPTSNVDLVNHVTSTPLVTGQPELSVQSVQVSSQSIADTSRYCAIVDLENGSALAVPSNDTTLVKINDSTGEATVIHTFTSPTSLMFSSAYLIGDHVYCIPYNYTSIVRVHRSTNTVEVQYVAPRGGALFADAVVKGTALYCIPYGFTKVVKVDSTNFTSVSPLGNTIMTGTAKFATGALVENRYIVCPPYNAATVLRIDTNDDTVSLVGSTGINIQLYNQRTNLRNSQLEGGGRGYVDEDVFGNPYQITGTVGQPEDTSGQTATFTATVQKTKIVSRIQFSGGSGYTSNPSVVFTGSGGTWGGYWTRMPAAIAEIDPSTGTVTNVTITSGGDGYMPARASSFAVSFSGGKGVDATAVAEVEGGKVVLINVLGGGSGYSSPPTVTLEGGSPTVVAEAEAILVNRSVAQIRIKDGKQGSGYKGRPQVRLSGGKGVNAFGTAFTEIDGKIIGVSIGNGGSGYSAESFTYQQWVADPTIAQISIEHPIETSTSNGSGNPVGYDTTSASARAVARIKSVSGGAITEIEMLWAGSGYVAAPGVTTTNGSATLSAVFKQDGRLEDIQIDSEGSKYITNKTIDIGDRLPSESASGGSATQASAFMYMDGNRYRYRSNTPTGAGKFTTCIAYQNYVMAFPYNTYRCILIASSGSWTELQTVDSRDFGLDQRQFASVVQSGTDVYVIPEQKRRILKISDLNTAQYVQDINGNSLFTGEWSDAVLAPDSQVIYAVPRNSDYILTIDTKYDALINRFVVPVVAQTRGPNKFAAVSTTTSGLLYACPADGDTFIEIDPGASGSSRTITLPAPSVKVGSSTLVYPPQDTTVFSVNVTPTTVTKTSATLPSAVVGTFGDGCVLPNGNIAWIPYYSITSEDEFQPRVIVYDPIAGQIVHTSPVLDIRYTTPYPTRSAVALDNDTIVWVPRDSTASMIKYTISSQSVQPVGTRDSESVSFATGTLVNGTWVGSVPDDVQITSDTSVPGFTTGLGSNSVRYEDACVTPSGSVVLAPAGYGTFKTYSADGAWKDYGGISFAFVSGIRMGGIASSLLDGKAYAVPFNHSRVLVVDEANQLVEEYGSFSRNVGLWRGAVEAGGYIFGIPYSSSTILVIDPLNPNPVQKLTTIDGPTGSSKWWGGAYSPLTETIYCAPFNASTVLVIHPGEFPEDTTYRTITLPTEALNTASSNRWCNPCIGPDQKVYCAPYNSSSILVIDPRTDTFDLINTYSLETAKYSRMLLSPVNNTIVMVPLRERSFVILNTETRRTEAFADYGTNDLKFETAIFVPSIGEFMAFPRYLAGVTTLRPRQQYLAYYNGSTYTKGSYVNTEFRMIPKLLDSSLLFHRESVVSTLVINDSVPLQEKKLVYMSPVYPGVTGWSDGLVVSARNDTFSFAVPDQGGFCGAVSFSNNSDLYAGIKDNVTFQCRTGNQTTSIPFIFDSIYDNGAIGVVGMYSDASRVYTFFKDSEVNRQLYSVDGDVGSTFSVGRLFGQQYQEIQVPFVSSTLCGLLSEVLVCKADVLDFAPRFGESQNYYFRETTNVKL